ncbi:NADPH dehydrogenase NamA [Viridibacillus sp. YIM B01967]|uniref:NADPH dehydrogenase NamA n=1 Tax=Viridibacillus soli TaxID=2798301 RepID=A0ABS1H849_9BACL|nr:NADPH dehydrogenase NamA [Viridibacillus soli]MBK3495198.1 NADPH dehydrogenase NamA [Viridibacillus soli]
MAKLFEPYTIGNVTLKNRIVMSPMCMYECSDEDGLVQDFHKIHYATRAVGQIGLIILEATAVQEEGRISPQDLGIWSDEHVNGLSELNRLMHDAGSKTGIQLAHAGRKAQLESNIYAPSAIAFSDEYKTPIEMTTDEINNTVEAFKKAAIRSKEAGFDVIELHGAHGYLINEFLSPLSNKRTDEYGGSAGNRYRFLSEVIDAVKGVFDGPLFVRISAKDYADGGMEPSDYIPMTQWMKEQGVDLIDVSSGAVVLARIPVFPGYQVPFAEKIKHETPIATGAVGLITSPLHAEEILQNDRADLVFLARELLRNPYWSYRAAKELGVDIEALNGSYQRGWK